MIDVTADRLRRQDHSGSQFLEQLIQSWNERSDDFVIVVQASEEGRGGLVTPMRGFGERQPSRFGP